MRARMRRCLTGLLITGLSTTLFAGSLVCEGVLGNSGEQAPSLVRWSEKPARGMGVVLDRYGFLWSRAGSGALNRYSVDGRLIAQYQIPGGESPADQLTLVGDTLVMQLNRQLYTLPISASSQTQVKSLKRQSDAISFGSAQGRIASVLLGQVYLVNVSTGEAQAIGKPVDQCRAIEMDDSETLYVVDGRQMSKWVGGEAVSEGGWPKAVPGERPQLIGGFWFGHSWHGTIRRFTANMDAAPGVTLGGGSGSFIGRLDEDPDLGNGRGMARLGDDLFAVSCLNGNVLLLAWDAGKQQFQVVRRVGAVAACGGVAIDQAGSVWNQAGAWMWSDRPDTPMHPSVPPQERVGQAIMLDGDTMVQPIVRSNQLALIAGRPSQQCSYASITDAPAIKNITGAAVYLDSRRLTLLTIDQAGRGYAAAIAPNGNAGRYLGEVSLTPALPVKQWTSLAVLGSDTLLAAADGHVIVMGRDGSNWREKARWNSWGREPAQHFGPWVYLTADAQHLWVSDRDRNRVLCFDLASSASGAAPLAEFGAVDQARSDLSGVLKPEALSAWGNRAVVFDSGNYRFIKLTLR